MWSDPTPAVMINRSFGALEILSFVTYAGQNGVVISTSVVGI